MNTFTNNSLSDGRVRQKKMILRRIRKEYLDPDGQWDNNMKTVFSSALGNTNKLLRLLNMVANISALKHQNTKF